MQRLLSGYYAVYTPQYQDSQQNGISITVQAVQFLSTCDANQVYSGGVTSFSNINNMTMNGIHIISVSKIVDAPKFGDESASFQVSGSLSDYNQPANAIVIMSKKNNQLLEVVIWDFGNSNAQLQQQSNQLMTKMIDKLDTLTIKAPQLENNVCSSGGFPIAELIGRFLGFALLYIVLKGLWDFWHNGVQNTLDKGNKILDEKFGKEKKKKL